MHPGAIGAGAAAQQDAQCADDPGYTIGIAGVSCVVAIGSAGSEQLQNQLNNRGDNLVWVEARLISVNGVRTR